MNAANTLDNTRDLLIAALNKNQVTFAQIAKTAESISNGQLKLKLDGGGKVFVFEYLNKHIILDLTSLKLHGLKYLNDIVIDDILTKVELEEVYSILKQVQDELLTKADKDHNHDDRYALKEHGHDFNVVHDKLTLNVNKTTLTDNLSTKYALIDHNHDDKYSSKTHNHDDKYSLIGHNHDDKYSSKTHNHDDKYSSKTHNHDAYYSSKTHNHDAYYAAKDHTHTSFQQLHVDDFDCNGDGHVYLSNSSNVMQLKPQSLTFTDMSTSSAVQINKQGITVNGKNVSLDGHTHNYDDKYAAKTHNHDDRYALKDHTHSELQSLQTKIDELQSLLMSSGYFIVEAYDTNDFMDIYSVGLTIIFKLKDSFYGSRTTVTVKDENGEKVSYLKSSITSNYTCKLPFKTYGDWPNKCEFQATMSSLGQVVSKFPYAIQITTIKGTISKSCRFKINLNA